MSNVNALDFSPAKRSKDSVTATAQKGGEKQFTQVDDVIDISCGDVDCALSTPKGFLTKKTSRTGAVFYTCTNNVRNTLSSCQFSAGQFRPDPKSGILCLVCTTAVKGSISTGKQLPDKFMIHKYWPGLGFLFGRGAACDALDNYLDVPYPLTEDTTITLSVGVIECEALDADTNPMEVEQIVVEGGTLTIASDSTVQFINVAFKVMPGAALVFDMPETLVGPNSGSTEDNPSGSLLWVSDGASLTFNGDVTMQEVKNVDILLKNYGTTEFKETVLIDNNVNAIPVNTGTIKFRGVTTFTGNDGMGIGNSDGGFVRFSTTVTFDDNGSQLDGFPGCDILNESASKISFRGLATFVNSQCNKAEGASLYNEGSMTFYGKAVFSDNSSYGNGGAVRNSGGSMTFRRAVQFNNNEAETFGGGIAVEGGDVTFRKAVKFSGNTADSGGAFAVLSDGDSGFGTLTFEKSSVVRFEDNTVYDVDDDGNCTIGEVEEGSTLIGYPDDDVCVESM